MGKDNELERKSNLETKYVKQGLFKDPFFGDFYMYNENTNNSKIISTEKLISDKMALKQEVDSIKKRILSKHDYILNLLDYSVEVQKNLCSTFFLLKSFYEYPNKSLKKDLNERKANGDQNNEFSKTDMTHFLYHQIMAHSHLQDMNTTHGDIYPGSIFVTTKRDYKIAFRLNQRFSKEKLQMERMMRNDPIYLSPKIYTALKKRNLSNIQHNAIKSDVFSLGLCVLEAGLLRSIQSVYSKGNEIDEHMLNIYLDEFEMKFEDNPLLFSSVRKMLEIDEEERPTFTDLLVALPEYAEICDYFYKVEHGLITEDDEMWDENAPDPNTNFNSDHYQQDPYMNQDFQQHDPNYVQSAPNNLPNEYKQQQPYDSQYNNSYKQNEVYTSDPQYNQPQTQFQPQTQPEPYYPSDNQFIAQNEVKANAQTIQQPPAQIIQQPPAQIIQPPPAQDNFFDKYGEMDFFGDSTPNPAPPQQQYGYQNQGNNIYTNSNQNLQGYAKRPDSQQTYGNNTTMTTNNQPYQYNQNQYYQPYR